MALKTDRNEIWCRKNITTEESQLFWQNWCQTQWGMPTFAVMRFFIENLRTHKAA
jgi:hypothetical protein